MIFDDEVILLFGERNQTIVILASTVNWLFGIRYLSEKSVGDKLLVWFDDLGIIGHESIL